MGKVFEAEAKRIQKMFAKARYYKLNSIMGNDWAIFYCIIGARKTRKIL